jgi:D-3-phosphoglycerate dehydrogenase
VYRESDYVSLHLGLTPQTRGMIDAAALAKMKPGVRIVNCARGELVDEAALLAALESRTVGGAALDVFFEEPPRDRRLLEHERVIATPHIGGSTAEAQDAVGVQIASQIREYLKSSIAQNAVNVPSLSDAEYRQLEPYLRLARKLGALLGQLIEGNVEEMRIAFSGAIARGNTSLLRSSAIHGLLGVSQEAVNLVNAEAQARLRGIKITELERQQDADLSLLTLHLAGGREQYSVVGTVVHGSSPRMIELNGAELETPLDGHMLVMRNRDVPGVVGKVGTILGEHGVNIARFALGREEASLDGKKGSGNALAAIQTDVAVPPATIKVLLSSPEILMLKGVVL